MLGPFIHHQSFCTQSQCRVNRKISENGVSTWAELLLHGFSHCCVHISSVHYEAPTEPESTKNSPSYQCSVRVWRGKPSLYKSTKGKGMYTFRKAYSATIVSHTMGGNSTTSVDIIRGCVPVKTSSCRAFNGSADGAIFLSGLINSTATRGLAICWCRKNSITPLITVHKGGCIAPPLTQHVQCRGHVRLTPSLSW